MTSIAVAQLDIATTGVAASGPTSYEAIVGDLLEESICPRVYPRN
jgi:hypothetical protein